MTKLTRGGSAMAAHHRSRPVPARAGAPAGWRSWPGHDKTRPLRRARRGRRRRDMKTVILAGGLGTRISEESHLKPKTMIEIGGRPVLWHIMKLYAHYGFNDFIVCLGYRGYVIK